MFLKLLIPILTVSLFALKSKQWDINNGTSKSPKWTPPYELKSQPFQISGQQNIMRQERNVNNNQAKNVNPYSSQSNLANSPSTPQYTIRSTNDSSNNLVDFIRGTYRGMYNSVQTNPFGYGYGVSNPYQPNGVYYSRNYNQVDPNSANSGNQNPFIFGVFSSNGCAGKDQADYTLHIVLDQDLICNRPQSPTSDEGFSSLTSQIKDVKTANNIEFIFKYQSGGQDLRTFGLFGTITSGNLQGNYIAVTVVLTGAQIMARCNPAIRTAFITASSATITILSTFDPVLFTQCDSNNQAPNQNCLNNLRAIGLVECTGTVQIF